jgi:hypothetical protein
MNRQYSLSTASRWQLHVVGIERYGELIDVVTAWRFPR